MMREVTHNRVRAYPESLLYRKSVFEGRVTTFGVLEFRFAILLISHPFVERGW